MTRSALPARLVPELVRYGLGNLDLSQALFFDYKKGECLSHEGQVPEFIQFIINGTVKVSVNASNGRTMMFCFDGPGDIIGSIELLSGALYTATAHCVTDVQCIAVAMNANMDFFKNDVDFLNYLCTDLSRNFARSSKNAATNVLYPLQTRLCSYISVTAQDSIFRESLTETSELLGTSYRHLLRCLDKLCTDGILEKQGRSYRISDTKKLRRLADDYYSM